MTDKQYKRADWIAGTNIYEVNIRQYTPEGTFNAFANELQRLRDMGVETLWLMPVTPISQKKRKGTMGSPYACSDYTTVNPELGSLEDLVNLVSTAHQLGFKLIIDWVANHTGWDHKWTVSNPAYYRKDSATGDFKMASGMDDIIELDYTNPALRQAMIEAMSYWVRVCDIDGFRCDLAFWVELDFWKEARALVENEKQLFWLGEFDPLDNPEYYSVFDAAYTWTWMHRTAAFYKDKGPLEQLLPVLQQYNDCSTSVNYPVWFTSNHDENSWNGTEYEKYGEMALALSVFCFTWEGVPMIYSGQELPNLKRLEFFEKDAINWRDNLKLHKFYKTLAGLRKENPALQAGQLDNTIILPNPLANKNCFAYFRTTGYDKVLVLQNWTNERTAFCLSGTDHTGSYIEVFENETVLLEPDQVINMDPWSFIVFVNKKTTAA